MKAPVLLAVGLVAAGLWPSLAFAAKASADIVPPQKRQTTVETAEKLAQRKAPPALPADLPSPFNPTDFDKPDPADPAFAGRAGGPAGGGPRPAAGGGATPAPNTPPVVQAPAGDRETLETLAAQITPSGMIELGGKPRLIIKSQRFEVGTRFTATYNNQDYELELVAIDRTTFTLRYRGEEITRPIKPVR